MTKQRIVLGGAQARHQFCAVCHRGGATILDGKRTLATRSWPALYLCLDCARQEYPELYPPPATRQELELKA